MRIWSIEGNRQRLDGGALFGVVPRTIWGKWVEADSLNRVLLATRALLLEDDAGRRILFDAGIGAFFEPKLKERYGVEKSENVLLASLESRGTSHEEIDVVVLSHLHFDHIGGLFAAHADGDSPRLLFPKARLLVGEKAWERANKPHARDRASFIPELVGLLRDSGRVEVVAGDSSPLTGASVRFRYADGHTPGLLVSGIGPKEGGVVFCSDLVVGRAWVHAPVSMGYDRFPERAVEEKSALLEDAISKGSRLFFAHDAGCALATPVKDERGRYGTKEEMPTVEGLAIG